MSCGTVPVLPRVLEPKSYESQLPNARQGLLSVPCAALAIAVQTPGAQVQVRTAVQSKPAQSGGDGAEPLDRQLKCDEQLIGDGKPAHAALPGAAHAAPRLPSSEPSRVAEGLRPCGYLECPLVAYHPGPCQARVMPERRRAPKRPRSWQAPPCVPDVLQPTEAEQAAFRAVKKAALEEAGPATSNAADAADVAVKELEGAGEQVATAIPRAREGSKPEPHARPAEQTECATASAEHEAGANGMFGSERELSSDRASAAATDAPSLPSLRVREASCAADTPVCGRAWREGAPGAHDASAPGPTPTATVVGARASSLGVTRVAQRGRGGCEALPHAAPAAAGLASPGKTNASVSAWVTSHRIIGATNGDRSSLASGDCGSSSGVHSRGECGNAWYDVASCRSAALGMGGRQHVGGGAAFLDFLERRVAAEAARAEATRKRVAQQDAAREEESALEAGHILQLLSVTQPQAKPQPRVWRQTHAAHGACGAHGGHGTLAAAPHARKKARPLPAALAHRRWQHDGWASHPSVAGSLAPEEGGLPHRDRLDPRGHSGCDGSARSFASSSTPEAAASAAAGRARVGTGCAERAVSADASYAMLVGGRASAPRRERSDAKPASAAGARRAAPLKPAASHRAAHAARARGARDASGAASAELHAASASQLSLDDSSLPRSAHLDAGSSTASASTSTSTAASTAANAGAEDAPARPTPSAPKASAQRREATAARTSSNQAQSLVKRDAGIASRRSNSAGHSQRRRDEGAVRERAARDGASSARLPAGAGVSVAGGHRARGAGRAGREGAARSDATTRCQAGVDDGDGDGDSASGSGSGARSNSGGGSGSGSSVRSVYGKGQHGLSKRLKGLCADEDGATARAASPLCIAEHAAAEGPGARRARARAAEHARSDGAASPRALSHASRRSAARDAGARRGHTDSHRTTMRDEAGVASSEQTVSEARGKGHGAKRAQGRGEKPADESDDEDDASEGEGPSLCGYLGCPLVAYHAGPCQVEAMPPRSRTLKLSGFDAQPVQPNKRAAERKESSTSRLARDGGASHKKAPNAATARADGTSARVSAAASAKQSKADGVSKASAAATAPASDSCAGARSFSSAAVPNLVKQEAAAARNASEPVGAAECIPLPLDSSHARQPVASSAEVAGLASEAAGSAGHARDDGREAAARSATASDGLAAVHGDGERQSDGESTAGREGVDEKTTLNKSEDKFKKKSENSSDEIKAADDGKGVCQGKSNGEVTSESDGKSERQSSFRPCGYLGCPEIAYHAGPCLALVADRPRGRQQRTGCARCFWAADGCAQCGNSKAKMQADADELSRRRSRKRAAEHGGSRAS